MNMTGKCERNLMDRRRDQGWGDSYDGHFTCSGNQLTSLRGAPMEIGGDFYCQNNWLTSLRWAPIQVRGSFSCSSNKLTSLEGAPTEVSKDFYCEGNNLTSLKGAPVNCGGSFSCRENQLTSLEGVPREINIDLFCHNNPITSLTGIGSYFRDGYINGSLVIPASVSSHILGTLLIPGLKRIITIGSTGDTVANSKLVRAERIINIHLAGDRDILECQEELRAAGLREYGKL